ncbi:DUF421 domain-containing protein [Geitlerinema sp. CS-897]|nr:DUF421 domain-containing protein [Geitlerinema sp. CS-897]
MFFNSLADLVRVVVVGILSYVSLILLLRVSGKRTLSKMNAFDLVVTVSLGTIIATTMLSKEVAWIEGMFGLCVLVGMQYLIAWLSVQSQGFRQLVKNEPTLLFHQGNMLSNALVQQRVAAGEVRAAIRNAGISHTEEVEAVILETDGTLSVLPKSDRPSDTFISDVSNGSTVSV